MKKYPLVKTNKYLPSRRDEIIINPRPVPYFARPKPSKKYGFTGETKYCAGRTLRRIVALCNFGNVKRGERGGFIESERNLAQNGHCWVKHEAMVFGNARVSGNAQVYGDAIVYDYAQVKGSAQVYGNVQVYNYAEVYGDARIYGEARIFNYAKVYGCAQVYGDAWVYGYHNCNCTHSWGYHSS